MSGRYRSWCFTWNNYHLKYNDALPTEEFCEVFFGKYKYIVMGIEVGSERKTKHIQGYIDFVNARTLGGLKKICKEIHWENRRGTWEEASYYCKKDGIFVEYGTPNEQGKRTDLDQLKFEILEIGLKVDSVAIENPMMYHKYGRTLNKIEDLAMRQKYRTEMTEGIWYWGPTGVGKSHKAFEGFTPATHYVYPNDGGWWDGYTQQETVIMNDFRGDIPYNELLQLIDKWPQSVRRRNREPMPFTSKRIIITSSLSPVDTYKQRNKRDNIEQLLRRVAVIFLGDSDTEVLEGNTNASSNYVDNLKSDIDNEIKHLEELRKGLR